MKETELASVAADWMTAQHWDVFPEVQIYESGGVADLVGIFDKKLVWIVECKLSLSMALISQAHSWKDYGHYVSIATVKPQLRRNKSRQFASFLLRHFGIGEIQIDEHQCISDIGPSLNRHALSKHMLKTCHEGHKQMGVAGSAKSQRWTPFKQTALSVLRFVKQHPGCTFKELVEGIEHHYSTDSTAKSSLKNGIENEWIKGIRIEREGRSFKLYPEDLT